MSSLAVLDASYVGIAEETEGARPFGVSVRDARHDVDGSHDEGGAADGALVQYATIDGDVLDDNPSWRVVGRYGVGYDTIDVAAATERGVAVFNVPDYCVAEVATHAAALALASVRRLAESDRMVRAEGWGEWTGLRPVSLPQSLTLGLIGLGQIGTATAGLLAPFFRDVIAFDPYAGESEGITLTSLDDVLERADVLSLHCPLTADTHHLLDADRIASMKPGAHVVNVSRGGLVNSRALADALHRGALGGAALDVLEVEPPAETEPMLTAPRTILTNHIAWLSEQSEPRLRRMLAERCAAYLVGDPVVQPLNAASLAERAVTRKRVTA